MLLVGQQEWHPAGKKTDGGMLACYLSGASCSYAYGPADATATLSLASVKSRLVSVWNQGEKTSPTCKH